VAKTPNVFIDHTFLIARFGNPSNDIEKLRRNRRSLEIFDLFNQRPFPPKYITTNSEVSRSITNIFRETDSSIETVSFINRLVSSNNPPIEVKMVTKKVYNNAIKEYRFVDSSYYEIGLEFLGLCSILFIVENKHFNIREVFSFDDKIRKIKDYIGVSVYY
jgi:hypothetical protein